MNIWRSRKNRGLTEHLRSFRPNNLPTPCTVWPLVWYWNHLPAPADHPWGHRGWVMVNRCTFSPTSLIKSEGQWWRVELNSLNFMTYDIYPKKQSVIHVSHRSITLTFLQLPMSSLIIFQAVLSTSDLACILLETQISPDKSWLDDDSLPFEMVLFQGTFVQFRAG